MPDDIVRECLQRVTRQLRDARRELFFVCSKLASAKARIRVWRDRVTEGARRGELKRVTDELTRAYDEGKFEKKTTLWNFLKDLVHATYISDATAPRNRAMRWSESTNRFMSVVRKFGGPRTQKFFYDNIGGPH